MRPATLQFDGIPARDLLPAMALDALSFGVDYVADGLRCSTPDPTKYHDPATQALEGSGRTLLQQTGRFGIRGTIIPRATFLGGSRGHNPHQVGTVVVDPHDPKGSITVDLTRVTPETARRAVAVAAEALGTPNSVDDVRLRAATTFHVLKRLGDGLAQPRRLDERGHAIPDGAAPAGLMPALPPVAPLLQPASFGPPPVAAAPAPAAAPPRPPGGALLATFAGSAPAAPPPPAGPEPAYLVNFGMEGGDFQAPCHSVIRQRGATPTTGALILGVAVGYRGPRFAPKAVRPFALRVEGTASVLLVEPTGLQFEHAGELLTAYLVLDERPAED